MDKPVNMMEALGTPDPHGPTKAPPEVAMRVMQLAAKYLLYERAEETALTAAFAQVVEERHKYFHTQQKYMQGLDKGKGKQLPWTLCGNMVCKEARDIIANTRKKEINISMLAANLMNEYIVNFMPMPNNLRLWLTKRSETHLPATEETKREAGRVVLTDN